LETGITGVKDCINQGRGTINCIGIGLDSQRLFPFIMGRPGVKLTI